MANEQRDWQIYNYKVVLATKKLGFNADKHWPEEGLDGYITEHYIEGKTADECAAFIAANFIK